MSPDNKDLSPLVDGIHDIAVAPDRLETLIDIWSNRLHHGSADAAGFNLLDAPQISSHVETAEFALRNAVETDDMARPAIATWVDSVRCAAVAVTRSGTVVACNQAAAESLGLFAGGPIADLGLVDADFERLLTEISAARPQKGGSARMVRLRRPKPSTPIVMRVIDGAGGNPSLVGLITTIISWPASLTDLVKVVFGLTAAESDVLRGLSLGQSVKEIAAASGRSEPTIRSHVSAVLEKTETRSQTELIRMTLGLLEAIELRPVRPSAEYLPASGYSTLILDDQRRLDYQIIGDPKGQPFLLMPGGVGASPFTSKHELMLCERRLRAIIPIRAGYGGSTALPPGRHVHDVAASDTFALMDHLGISRIPFVTICDDFRIAIALAGIQPGRMAAILGCGASMPAVTHEHYFRMSKWRRFASANARYAPRALPYLGLALFSRLRRLGPSRVMHNLMSDSPADLKAIADPEVMAAIARGAEDTSASSQSSHISWAAETAAHWSADWSDALSACRVPITLFAGHQDPLSPIETVKDYAAAIPKIRLFDFPDCGQLLYPYTEQLFDAIEDAARTVAP